MQAVTRVKLEQASKVVMWTPTRPGNGEGSTDREERALTSGWSAYFSYGTRTAAYGAVENYVYENVRHFLRRRHQVQSRGASRFSKEAVFGELGVLQLRRVKVNPRS